MAAAVNPIDIHPRQVANKSDKKALLEAIRMTLGVETAAIAIAMTPWPALPTTTR